MPTVIDSLVVELGLDPKPAAKGGAEFKAEIKKTRDFTESSAKDIEAYGKKAASFFSSLRNEAVGLFLAFQGASSISGFVSDMLHGDAATGRFAGQLGMATSRLSAWQLAVKEMNGDAKDATSALATMKQAFMGYELHGDTGNNPAYAGLGVTKQIMDQGPEAMLLQLAKASEKMSKPMFYARTKELGLPDSVIYTLEKGRKAVEALIKEKEKEGAATQKDADAAAEYERQTAKLSAHIQQILRPQIYGLVDALDKLLGSMDKNKETVPIFRAVLAGLGGAAVIALAPFLAIPAAIAAATYAMDTFIKNHPDVRKRLDSMESPLKNMLPKSMQWLFEPFGSSSSPSDAGGGSGGGNPGGLGADAGGPGKGVASTKLGQAFMSRALARAGVDPEVAKGIIAGASAEGGGLGMSANGAFGIGQWRGTRLAALHAKYGEHVSLANQVDFLIAELKGGDPGGRSVLGSHSADEALRRYVYNFMRPQGKHGEHEMDAVRDVGRGRGQLRRGIASAASAGAPQTQIHIGTVAVHTNSDKPDAHAKAFTEAVMRRRKVIMASRGLDH